MKQSHLWILGGVAATVLVLGGMRLATSREQAPADAARTPAAPASAPEAVSLELAPGDLLTVSSQPLQLGVPVSGTLKATRSAVLKARVAGELMDLTVREGDAVQAGQTLARIDPVEYQARWRQAQQQADAAKAQMDIAQKQFDNNDALVRQGFISQTALQTSQMSLSGAQATYRSAVAAADVARKALDDTVLKAPIAGQISQRLAQPGERVAIDARVVEIVNLAQLELEAALTPQDAAQVRVGMQAQLKVEGLDQPVSAKVLRINPSTQAGSRNVSVYLGVAGREGMRQGAFAQGALGTRTLQALAVPLGSVRTDKPQPYVQAVVEGVVRHVPVQTGARSLVNGDTLVAVSGVSEGTPVLAASVGAVREGVKVQSVQPAATAVTAASAPGAAAAAAASR